MDLLTPALWRKKTPPGYPIHVDQLASLPEKVLQFGTGVLLRGLPDYFIDLANKEGVFNGRIVVVKSTSGNDLQAFHRQGGIYTHVIRGIDKGKVVEETIINASISRVLSAHHDWPAVLATAENREMQVVISNTTEAGLVYVPENIAGTVPGSYPGKLLAWLLHRFNFFSGDTSAGMVIIPTELIPRNGEILQKYLIDLAHYNALPTVFLEWLRQANDFCTSLVDRIVPGALPPNEQDEMEKKLGYSDPLMISSEPYALWAITVTSERVKHLLTFSKVHPGVLLVPDISLYVTLKLRLLNGSHTLSCGLAFLAGFHTVREAMQDPLFSAFMEQLLLDELAPAVAQGDITDEMARTFAHTTLDRYRNPFIAHPWLSITLQYTSKMRIRAVPLFENATRLLGTLPPCMALGFAGYLLFMKSKQQPAGQFIGETAQGTYPIRDDQASFLCSQWEKSGADKIVEDISSASSLWGQALSTLPGFIQNVNSKLQQLLTQGIRQAIAMQVTGKF